MRFIVKRILAAVVVLFVVINLDFFLPRLVPGNAAELLAVGRALPAGVVRVAEARLGLNQPLYMQYYIYMKGIFTNWPPFFGYSFTYFPTQVSTLIAERAPWTLLLVLTSVALAFSLSYVVAGLSSMRRGGKLEAASLYTSIAFWSVPSFWVGLVLIWIFGVTLGWFPFFGTVGFNPGSGLSYVFSVIMHLVLPVATLTIVMFGHFFFLLRGSVQEAVSSDYVLAAEARGVRQRVIVFGYVMRNSLLPIASLMGYFAANLVSIAIVVEDVFGYNGIGDIIVDGVIHKDYPLIEGSLFYLTLIVILLSLLGDFLLLKLDPRLRR